MGGGTLLIPILTIMLGVDQHVAQATNLIAFLPMALFSLQIHRGSGLLKLDGLLWLIIPAVISSVAGAVLARFLAGEILKKLFGAFLIFLGVRGILSIKPKKSRAY